MGTKSAIFDTEGNLVALAFEESKLHYPRPGWVEQDPDEIYWSAAHTIKECLEKSGINPPDVAAISLDGQMAGVSTVDEGWRACTVYDSWLDTRCAPYIEQMKIHEDLIIKKTGGPPTYSHGPKVLWWKNERPEVFSRICKFVMPAAYVAGRMAGLAGEEAFIDYTYLHFSCFSETAEASWSSEICELFQVPMEKLPRIVEPWEIIGRMTPKAANDCGLLSGTPIAAGCGDQAASILGAGIVKPGMILDVAGTASLFSISTDKFSPDLKHKTLFSFRSVPTDLWGSYAYVNGGGLNLRWFRDQFAQDLVRKAQEEGGSAYRMLDAEAASVQPGSESLLFLPHLGGRVTPNDPHVRGSWLGLTWNHQRKHLYRSILESIAYEYACYLDVARITLSLSELKEVRVIGGGADSRLWNQIKADVLGISYVRLDQKECAVLGSAIVAGYAVGVFEDLTRVASRFARPIERFEPESEEVHNHYRQLVALYRSLFDTLRQTHTELGSL